jgi:hypothetical protein
MTLIATWVTGKVENVRQSCNIMIISFFKAIYLFSPHAKDILGPSSTQLTAPVSVADFYFGEFHGKVRAAEKYFLKVLAHRFINCYPFIPLNTWIQILDEQIGTSQSETTSEFKRMSSGAAHCICTFLVTLSDGPLPDVELLTAASLTAALDAYNIPEFPAHGPNCWADKIGLTRDREEILTLANMIWALEDQLRPFEIEYRRASLLHRSVTTVA